MIRNAHAMQCNAHALRYITVHFVLHDCRYTDALAPMRRMLADAIRAKRARFERMLGAPLAPLLAEVSTSRSFVIT